MTNLKNRINRVNVSVIDDLTTEPWPVERVSWPGPEDSLAFEEAEIRQTIASAQSDIKFALQASIGHPSYVGTLAWLLLCNRLTQTALNDLEIDFIDDPVLWTNQSPLVRAALAAAEPAQTNQKKRKSDLPVFT